MNKIAHQADKIFDAIHNPEVTQVTLEEQAHELGGPPADMCWCKSCGDLALKKEIDIGDFYDCGSDSGWESNWQNVSHCCESNFTELTEEELEQI